MLELMPADKLPYAFSYTAVLHPENKFIRNSIYTPKDVPLLIKHSTFNWDYLQEA